MPVGDLVSKDTAFKFNSSLRMYKGLEWSQPCSCSTTAFWSFHLQRTGVSQALSLLGWSGFESYVRYYCIPLAPKFHLTSIQVCFVEMIFNLFIAVTLITLALNFSVNASPVRQLLFLGLDVAKC